MRTNTNKLIAWALLASFTLISSVSAATQIGTGTVQGSGALVAPITWDDAFPWTATGTINGIIIKAKILPTLNMAISGSGTIDLGDLSSASYSTGTVSIEIGTNAVNGAAVTARSTNGGLRNGTGSDYLNNLTADGIADNYTFSSTLNAVADSSFSWSWTQAGMAVTEVNNNSTLHSIYTSNKPQATNGLDDIVFSVATKPDAQSPAGNYSDVIVVTVTGTF